MEDPFDGLAAELQTHYRNMQDDLYDGLTPKVVEATNQALAWDQSPANVLAHGLVAGMDAVADVEDLVGLAGFPVERAGGRDFDGALDGEQHASRRGVGRRLRGGLRPGGCRKSNRRCDEQEDESETRIHGRPE